MKKWKRAVAMGLTAMLALAGSGENDTGNNTANDTIAGLPLRP